MKAFQIIGGALSPSAVVPAENWQQAKDDYNDWLELTYGRRDNGVGVTELLPHHVAVYGTGSSVYAPGCRGYVDPRFK